MLDEAAQAKYDTSRYRTPMSTMMYFFIIQRLPPGSTPLYSPAASDGYKGQVQHRATCLAARDAARHAVAADSTEQRQSWRRYMAFAAAAAAAARWCFDMATLLTHSDGSSIQQLVSCHCAICCTRSAPVSYSHPTLPTNREVYISVDAQPHKT